MDINNADDKIAVIIAVTIIAIYAMWWNGAEAGNIVLSISSGLFGVAVGKSIK